MNDFEPSGQTKPKAGFARIALLLCVAWLLAGALFKLYKGSPNDLPESVQEMSPLGLYDTFRWAIALELCIAALAIFWARVGWVFVAMIYAIFLGILGMLVAEGATNCGCFGSSVTLKPWHMMTIDGVLLLLLLISQPWKRFGSGASAGKRLAVLVPIFAIAFWLPWTKHQEIDFGPDPGVVVDGSDDGNQDPASPGPGTAKVDTGKAVFHELKTDTWEGAMWFETDAFLLSHPPDALGNIPVPAHVVVYRKSCEHCQAHIEELALNPIPDKAVVLLRIPEIDDANVPNVIELKPDGAIEVELQPLERGYAIHTPSSFDIDEAFMVQNFVEHKEDE